MYNGGHCTCRILTPGHVGQSFDIIWPYFCQNQDELWLTFTQAIIPLIVDQAVTGIVEGIWIH